MKKNISIRTSCPNSFAQQSYVLSGFVSHTEIPGVRPVRSATLFRVAGGRSFEPADPREGVDAANGSSGASVLPVKSVFATAAFDAFSQATLGCRMFFTAMFVGYVQVSHCCVDLLRPPTRRRVQQQQSKKTCTVMDGVGCPGTFCLVGSQTT